MEYSKKEKKRGKRERESRFQTCFHDKAKSVQIGQVPLTKQPHLHLQSKPRRVLIKILQVGVCLGRFKERLSIGVSFLQLITQRALPSTDVPLQNDNPSKSHSSFSIDFFEIKSLPRSHEDAHVAQWRQKG